MSKVINNNRRYYLHSKLKLEGYSYNSYNHTIFVPYGVGEEDLSTTAKTLRDKFNYQIEVVIPEFFDIFGEISSGGTHKFVKSETTISTKTLV